MSISLNHLYMEHNVAEIGYIWTVNRSDRMKGFLHKRKKERGKNIGEGKIEKERREEGEWVVRRHLKCKKKE